LHYDGANLKHFRERSAFHPCLIQDPRVYSYSTTNGRGGDIIAF